MKKGFTLVEIIISISLILIVGVSTTFFIFNNKNNRKLEKVTKEVLLAANLYVNKEVDDNGNIYINAIKNGKKGVKIPLTNLVSSGYIDESLQKEVIDLSNKGNGYNYYVMLLDGNEEGLDYCDGDTFSLASWIDPDKDKDIFLCNGSQVGQEDNNHNGNLAKHLISSAKDPKNINLCNVYDFTEEGKFITKPASDNTLLSCLNKQFNLNHIIASTYTQDSEMTSEDCLDEDGNIICVSEHYYGLTVATSNYSGLFPTTSTELSLSGDEVWVYYYSLSSDKDNYYDDYTSYAYRGLVADNYIKFGTGEDVHLFRISHVFKRDDNSNYLLALINEKSIDFEGQNKTLPEVVENKIEENSFFEIISTAPIRIHDLLWAGFTFDLPEPEVNDPYISLDTIKNIFNTYLSSGDEFCVDNSIDDYDYKICMQNVYGLSDLGGYIGDNTENFGVNIQVYTKKHSESYPKNNSYPKEGRRIILVKQNENTKFNGIGTKDNPYVIVSK